MEKLALVKVDSWPPWKATVKMKIVKAVVEATAGVEVGVGVVKGAGAGVEAGVEVRAEAEVGPGVGVLHKPQIVEEAGRLQRPAPGIYLGVLRDRHHYQIVILEKWMLKYRPRATSTSTLCFQ